MYGVVLSLFTISIEMPEICYDFGKITSAPPRNDETIAMHLNPVHEHAKVLFRHKLTQQGALQETQHRNCIRLNIIGRAPTMV